MSQVVSVLKWKSGRAILVAALFSVLSLLPLSAIECNSGHHLMEKEGGSNVDLLVDGLCFVTDISKQSRSLRYVFHNVNVINGGMLMFVDGQDIDFYAESILIEYMGLLQAGTQSQAGSFKSRLTFHLWGKDTEPGIQCQSKLGPKGAPCGIPDDLWTSNTQMSSHMNMPMPAPPDPPKNAACKASDQAKYGQFLPEGDCFYQYEIFDNADKAAGRAAYFGHKVLAVSFGGSLKLFGSKGTTYLSGECNPNDPANECSPASAGTSWRRLTKIDGTTLTLNHPENPVQWKAGDHVVVTTTDYLPRHSEEMVLASAASDNKIVLTSALAYPHNANQYAIPSDVPSDIGPANDPNITDVNRAVDTRAAVALLSRNIQIVSAGITPNDEFKEQVGNYFGGHTIVRQGFLRYQVQGVEFYQLGQGGVIGRYPVHFHMDRRTPQQLDPTQGALNFLKDCSIHDSMTRWVTIHATQGMYVARNVGFLSIGHGFFLEDATEINNKLYSNIGIMARAAIQNRQNPRQVPGILADTKTDNTDTDHMPYRSDFNHPTVFWIMNGWNDFEYNMAAGAATCGACYWWLPGAVSGPSQYEFWDGYASQQIWGPVTDPNNPQSKWGNVARAGLTPLKTFVGNSCVAAMSSFQTVGNTNQCFGVFAQGGGGLAAVSSEAPRQQPDPNQFDIYYPTVTDLRNPTVCTAADNPNQSVQCGQTPGVTAPACDSSSASNCAATVLDHYSTSFNWAQTNFSAVWLRPRWFLVSNSAVTDIQTGGINFVTGGGYTRADVPPGFWSVLRKSVLVGHTQKQGLGGSFFALDSGPFNPLTKRVYGLTCDTNDANNCRSAQEGVTFILPAFPGQRLFNIYDGPAFQEYNAYLNTTTTSINDCDYEGNGNCGQSGYPLARNIGVLKDVVSSTCYLPNAAIAWKQPNGFYYPPSFYSKKLWFDNVQIRHFVVEPFFVFDKKDPYDPFVQSQSQIVARYCTYNAPDHFGRGTTFNGFNHIDRETVLNDADGSLTGLLAQDGNDKVQPIKPTISINEDSYFNEPVITPECLSDKDVLPDNPEKRVYTARTSPYEWLTTAMVADCAIQSGKKAGNLLQCLDDQNRVRWANACTDPSCRGVPLYREDLTTEEEGTQPSIRMMGQSTSQRSTLSLNHGAYYIDTTQTCDSQGMCPVCTLNPQGTDCRYCKPGTSDCWNNPGDIDPNPWHPTKFLADQIYYVYFVYAKPSTIQTYDIYVGSPNYEIQLVRADLSSQAYKFNAPLTGGDWLYPPPQYNSTTKTVRVSVDFSQHQSDFDKSKATFCQPRSFCMPEGSGANQKCVCKPGTSCTDNAVCAWGQNDIDCPQDPDRPGTMGCYGFSIKMPSDFDPQMPIMPDQSLFQNFDKNPYFGLVGFKKNVESSGKDCKYTK